MQHRVIKYISFYLVTIGWIPHGQLVCWCVLLPTTQAPSGPVGGKASDGCTFLKLPLKCPGTTWVKGGAQGEVLFSVNLYRWIIYSQASWNVWACDDSSPYVSKL